jgi:hypothetical protein
VQPVLVQHPTQGRSPPAGGRPVMDDGSDYFFVMMPIIMFGFIVFLSVLAAVDLINRARGR